MGLLPLAAVVAVSTAATPEIAVPHGSPADSDPDFERARDLDRKGRFSEAAAVFQGLATRLLANGQETLAKRVKYHATLSRDIAMYERQLAANRGFIPLFQAGVQVQNKFWAFVVERGEKVASLFARAETLFRDAMLADTRAANPVVCLAALYLQAGDKARANETIRLIRTRPITLADEYNFAFYLALRGDLTAAFRFLERSLRRDPKLVDWILESDDFHDLRQDVRLVRLIERYRGATAPPLRR